MPRGRKTAPRRAQRELLRKADLPSVPEFDSRLISTNRAADPPAADDADPTEDAIRKMIEAAYT